MGFVIHNKRYIAIKWQNTADIVAILYGLKQETVSLLAWKSAQGICGTMIAYFQKEDGRNSVSCITPYGMVQGTLFCVLT